MIDRLRIFSNKIECAHCYSLCAHCLLHRTCCKSLFVHGDAKIGHSQFWPVVVTVTPFSWSRMCWPVFSRKVCVNSDLCLCIDVLTEWWFFYENGDTCLHIEIQPEMLVCKFHWTKSLFDQKPLQGLQIMDGSPSEHTSHGTIRLIIYQNQFLQTGLCQIDRPQISHGFCRTGQS